MHSKPLVTVITPVYNTGEYLEEAIQSVLAQTYDNWRYVISDNHSTDDTAAIAARYAELDPRITIVRPPTFLAQVHHFNFALEHLDGDSTYCKVLLADDKMLPACLAEMIEVAETSDHIGLVGSYRLIETEAAGFGIPLGVTDVPGRVAGRLHLIGRVYPFGTPSSVMYRASEVRARNPTFYPVDRIYFDSDAAFEIVSGADLGFVHQVLTFSRFQPDSITHRERTLYSGELDRVLCLAGYGERFLDADELRRATAEARRSYYEKLGREWLLDRFRRRRTELWDYHTGRLATIGATVERRELWKGAGRAIFRALGQPSEVVKRVVHRTPTVDDPWAGVSAGPRS
ncbi:MAG: glycosyltransferase family A protein [Ilumatobacteraceae bacterium]